MLLLFYASVLANASAQLFELPIDAGKPNSCSSRWYDHRP